MSACLPAGAVFADQGVADTSTVTFDLQAGSYDVTFEAVDRDPMLGCPFSIELIQQPPDPLSNGVVADASPTVTVPPRGGESGRFTLTASSGGRHYLRVSGTCAWNVAVYRSGPTARGW
jgi:hypothetical protein